MKKPRVLFVHEALGDLGDRIRVENVYNFLRNHGFIVHRRLLPSVNYSIVKTQNLPSALVSLLPLHRVKGRYSSNPFLSYLNLNLAKNFVERVNTELEFDIILAEASLTGWKLLELAKKRSAPLIIDVQGLAGAEARGRANKSWFDRETLEAEAFRLSTHLLVVSNGMKSYLTSRFGLADDKISVVYNGATIDGPEAHYDLPLKVIFSGRLAYWEKVDDFLEIAKRADPFGFKFYLAGSGELRRRTLSRISREKIPVKFLGLLPRDTVLKLMSTMQIGIAPSTNDTARLVAFPIKVLDYMSRGLPVITPNLGDWGEMINSEDCGIALKEDSIDNYLDALETLKDKKEWDQKSRNGIRAIRAQFGWDRVLLPIRQLIMDICSGT